jgi:HEPN domain-containing protein
LKAYYVKIVSTESPFTHDLLQIAEKAHLTLSEKQKDLLDLVTTFNIRTRYTDYKLEFYKKCTKEYTETNIKKIKEFRVWAKKKLAE